MKIVKNPLTHMNPYVNFLMELKNLKENNGDTK